MLENNKKYYSFEETLSALKTNPDEVFINLRTNQIIFYHEPQVRFSEDGETKGKVKRLVVLDKKTKEYSSVGFDMTRAFLKEWQLYVTTEEELKELK